MRCGDTSGKMSPHPFKRAGRQGAEPPRRSGRRPWAGRWPSRSLRIFPPAEASGARMRPAASSPRAAERQRPANIVTTANQPAGSRMRSTRPARSNASTLLSRGFARSVAAIEHHVSPTLLGARTRGAGHRVTASSFRFLGAIPATGLARTCRTAVWRIIARRNAIGAVQFRRCALAAGRGSGGHGATLSGSGAPGS
jgi:hypothetical protein